MAADACVSAAFCMPLDIRADLCYDEATMDERRWIMMERYLTEKCRPGRGVKLLENTASALLFLFFLGCIYVTLGVLMVGAQFEGGLGVTLLLPLIPAVLALVAMNALAERIRARKHAQVIVKKLQEAGGCVPADEAEAVIGVRKAAQTALSLVEKGYLADVRLEKGVLLLAGAEVDLPEEKPVVTLFHDVEV